MLQTLLEHFQSFLHSLSVSDIIEVFGIITSTLASIVAIVISLKSLKQAQITNKQNNQMLEENSRPYIAIFLDTITICEQSSFLVLKNFGKSSGHIILFEYDPVLRTAADTSDQRHQLINEQYDFVQGLTLAPGQSKMMLCDVTRVPKDTVSFKIGYTCREKYYEESIDLNIKNYTHIPVPRPNSKIPQENERQVQSLREIIERMV